MVVKNIMKDVPENVKINKKTAKIDATGMYYRDLNSILRNLDSNGIEKIEIHNVYGQRYIGTDLDNHISIDGKTELSFTEDRAKRFKAYGWNVRVVEGDGNDYNITVWHH